MKVADLTNSMKLAKMNGSHYERDGSLRNLLKLSDLTMQVVDLNNMKLAKMNGSHYESSSNCPAVVSRNPSRGIVSSIARSVSGESVMCSERVGLLPRL